MSEWLSYAECPTQSIHLSDCTRSKQHAQTLQSGHALPSSKDEACDPTASPLQTKLNKSFYLFMHIEEKPLRHINGRTTAGYITRQNYIGKFFKLLYCFLLFIFYMCL